MLEDLITNTKTHIVNKDLSNHSTWTKFHKMFFMTDQRYFYLSPVFLKKQISAASSFDIYWKMGKHTIEVQNISWHFSPYNISVTVPFT
jgi:hypothetical protein